MRPSLLVSSVSFEEPFDVVLRFDIEPDWYLYWINPGDAGLTVEASWDLPEGWTAGPLRFPTPEKIVKGGITAFGYHHELVLLSRIVPAAAHHARTSQPVLGVNLDWLVCRESCLPGNARLQLPLEREALEHAMVSPERLAELRKRFPLPLESGGIRVDSLWQRPEGGGTIVGISLSRGRTGHPADFYPEPIEGYTLDLSSIQVTPTEITLRLTPESSHSVLRSVRGILIFDQTGYQFEASVGPR